MVDKKGMNVCKIDYENYEFINGIKAKLQWEKKNQNITFNDALRWIFRKVELGESVESKTKIK